jgi:TonB family protein
MKAWLSRGWTRAAAALRGRLPVGLLASFGIHLALLALVLWIGPPQLPPKYTIKKGDALVVELADSKESDPAGRGPGRPAPLPQRASPGAPGRPSPPATAKPTPPPRAPAPRPAEEPPVVATRPPERALPAREPALPAAARATPPERVAPPPAPRPTPAEPPRVVASRPPDPPPPAPAPPRVVEPLAPEPEPRALDARPTPPKPESPAPPGAGAEAPRQPARPGNGAPAAGSRSGVAGPQIAALPPQAEPGPAFDIRSALRGGPGGRGGGRGGITGDAIPLDGGDPRFSDYLELIRRAIQDKMAFPCNRDRATGRCQEPTNTRVVVDFGILRDGRLQFADIVMSSNETGYDENSVRAIHLAAPFPPIPPAIMATRERGSTGVPIRCVFNYIVTTNFSTILR